MFEIENVNQLFDVSTEIKDTLDERKEKNQRRLLTICMKVPEVLEVIHTLYKGILEAIQIVNERYAKQLDNKDIIKAKKEIKTFYKIICNSHIDITTKAYIITKFDFVEYKKMLSFCNINGIKSLSRLKNMKEISNNFINGKVNGKIFRNDLLEQKDFFDTLISKYEDISNENFYAYILRYDLKTNKKISPIGRIMSYLSNREA